MLIKVLGPGCAKCKEAENVVNAAVQDAGSAATVEKVTDLKEMMALGVMSTPAVVIDNNGTPEEAIRQVTEILDGTV